MDKRGIIDSIKLNWKVLAIVGIIFTLVLIIFLFFLLSGEDIKHTTGSAEVSNENLKDNSFNSQTNYTQTITSNDSTEAQGFRVVSISENIYYTPPSGNTTNYSYNIVYFTSPSSTDTPTDPSNPLSNPLDPNDPPWGYGSTDDPNPSGSSVPGMPTLGISWKKIFDIF